MTTLTADTLENISVIYRQEISASGNRLDELKSALQKYIRRNLPEYAARCGAELYCFVYKPQGKRIFTNLVHRLMIIYLEDIGLAGIAIWDQIDKFIDQILYGNRGEIDTSGNVEVLEEIEGSVSSEAALVYLIEYMSKLPHSRTLSHFHSVFIPTDSDIEEILDEDLSGIKEVRKRARSWKILPNPDVRISKSLFDLTKNENIETRNAMFHLGTAILNQDPETAYECLLSLLDTETKTRSTSLEEEDTKYTGTRASNSGSVLNIILPVLCVCMKILEVKQEGFTWKGEYSDFLPNNLLLITRKWYKELEGTKEADLSLRLVILAMSSYKKAILASRYILGKIKIHLDVEEIFSKVGEDLTIHEYAIDMHTRKGKQLGKNRVDFVKEGSYVVNEDAKVIVNDYKEVYNRLKYKHAGIEYKEEFKKESDKFLVISRVQLTCSKSRPCTYLAKDKEELRKTTLKHNKNTIYFVKGPYKNREDAEVPLRLSKLKREINQPEQLPFLAYNVVKLLPDLFEDVPLGIRKNIDRTRPAYFLVCESLLQIDDEEEIPLQEKSSKLWDNETVVDWDAIKKEGKIWQFGFKDIIDPDIDIDRDELMFSYIVALFWRHIIGIPDPADRNFMVYRNSSSSSECNGEEVCIATEEEGEERKSIKLYSLDEENINAPSDYTAALKGDRSKLIILYLKKEWNRFEPIIKFWREKIFMTLEFDKKTTQSMLSRLGLLLDNKKHRETLFKAEKSA